MQRLKLLFDTSRPISWVNTAYPFAAGYLVSGGSLDLTFWLATIFFLILYNLIMYGVNDVFDYESDINNPRKGSIEGAITPKKFHPLILWSSLLISLPFIIPLLLLGTLASNLILIAVLFFAVAYSIKGLRFKEIPFLDSITSSLHFVGPLVFALALFDFPSVAWPFVVAFFLWGLASHAFGAVQDIIPDRKAGISSIATVIGAKTTITGAIAVYISASLLLYLQGGISTTIGMIGLLYAINLLPFVYTTDKTSAETNAGWKRFLWLNYIVGAVITMALIVAMI